MSDGLTSPPSSVMLAPGFIFEDTKTLEVYCHDRTFKDVSVFSTTDKKELFRVDSKGAASWSLRRALKDSTGKHVLDFRHHSLDIKNRWVIESPDGKKLASIEHVNYFTKSHSAVDATIFGANNGTDVLVEMRPLDRSALNTVIKIEGAIVAEISLVADNDIMFNKARGKDRTVWSVRVAAGVDLALILVMVLCRAEMSHVWRQ